MAWAKTVGDETERAQMIGSVIKDRSWLNAESGFEMAKSLEDPILRRDGLLQVFTWWRFQPEASARGFLSLPEADRSEALAAQMLDWLKIEPSRSQNPEWDLRDWLREHGEVNR